MFVHVFLKFLLLILPVFIIFRGKMEPLTKLKEFFYPSDFKEIKEANKKYLTHFSFFNLEDRNSINIWKANNVRFFINEAMRHGNCFTLYHDLNFFNLHDLWDEIYFKNMCQWVYLTFTQPQFDKELEKIINFYSYTTHFLFSLILI